jgi:hypothetical protein
MTARLPLFALAALALSCAHAQRSTGKVVLDIGNEGQIQR